MFDINTDAAKVWGSVKNNVRKTILS